MEFITYEVVNQVARITFQRPEVYNAFNRGMSLEVQSALDTAKADDDVRAILLMGSGKAFSAGQDLQELNSGAIPDISIILQEHFNPIVERLRSIELPIVGAVNGVAAGAGASFAFACDITVAKRSATFVQAFSKVGLIPDSGGTYFLPRIIGLQRAAALTMLAEKITAEMAEDMGLIYKVFPDESFEEQAIALAERLAAMPTKALGLTKRALNAGLQNSLEAQLHMEDQLQSQAAQTEDYQEGVAAFLEKRKPVYKGK